jgi:signal peptidase I
VPLQPEDFLTPRTATATAAAPAPVTATTESRKPAYSAPSAARTVNASNDSNASHATRLELAAEVLHRFGEVRFIAYGGSMVPSIYPGDLLIVRSESAADARRGEIVLFLLGGRPCVHRVMRKWPERNRVVFATRGDALPKEDPSVDASQLLGRVTSIQRRGKSVAIVIKPGPFTRAWRWSVRSSPALTRLLLATHHLRTRLAGRTTTFADPSQNSSADRLNGLAFPGQRG